MHSISNTPTRQQLRNFGLIMGTMIALFFGLLIPWIWDLTIPVWPWALAALFCVWGLSLPNTLSPVYRAWIKLGHGLGWVNTRILLGIIFYLIIMPVGLLMRLAGKDPMSRHFERDRNTYRIESTSPPRNSLEKPF